MSINITRLGNGVRVVTHHMPQVETASLGVWVSVGARDENEHEHGISHLLEHMAFKGTARRTAQGIAEEIEQVGGELNAATSLEMTAYYARVLKADVGLALDILADILQNPSYSVDELEREREVILQEIAATRDSPDETVFDLAQDAAFPEQPVGRPILGTPDSIKALGVADLRTFLKRHYGAARIVVAAAGNVDHASVSRHAEALFGSLNGEQRGESSPAKYLGGVRSSSRPFEQSHLVVGFEGPSYRDSNSFAAQVFSGLFGGGMSSRLFQEVRERRGLCYSIYSSCWGLADSGFFSVHAATGPEMLKELIEVVSAEIRRAASETPSAKEVDRAKAQLKAGLLMGLESSGARAEQMARQMIVHDRLLSVEELIARVEAVTPQTCRDIAEQLVATSAPTIALVGAGNRAPEYLDLASKLMRA